MSDHQTIKRNQTIDEAHGLAKKLVGSTGIDHQVYRQ